LGNIKKYRNWLQLGHVSLSLSPSYSSSLVYTVSCECYYRRRIRRRIVHTQLAEFWLNHHPELVIFDSSV
jgi:hypothetical protein